MSKSQFDVNRMSTRYVKGKCGTTSNKSCTTSVLTGASPNDDPIKINITIVSNIFNMKSNSINVYL